MPASDETRLTELSDLIGRCALKDRRAFSVLYDRTSAKLFGVILRILKDRAQSEDLLQDVYIRIWNKADRYRAGPFSPMSWLIAIARNAALDRLRGRKPAALDLDVAMQVADEAPDPERQVQSSEVRRQIDFCLDQLDADRAEAVRHAYLDGFSYQELADRFKVPLNTMRTWLRRSLIKLRDCLSA